jgi:superfamily II DNA or RNA helicase
MLTPRTIDRFLDTAKGQALREGTRYAREARVGDFVGSGLSATTLVRGATGDYEVALWLEGGALTHRCSCPSWRDPCKHEVAAALVLRQSLAAVSPVAGTAPPGEPDTGEDARQPALHEREVSARRERLVVKPDVAPLLHVGSGSGFAYLVRLRGGADGPHSCECPDFEANRLHTCKHVERARRWLRGAGRTLPRPHRREALRPGIFMHFGEVVEPRLFGRPAGRGSTAVRAAFDELGIPLRPLAREAAELRRWLSRFGDWVEPQALAWLDARIARTPILPSKELHRIVPPLPLAPYPYQWTGATFLATTGRALLADEMGLGKSIQALLAAVALRHASPAASHVTIVCPASLRGNWAEELQRWLGESAVLLEGATPERAHIIASRPAWLVTHYEQVLRDHRAHAAHPPDLMIVDEAQRAKGLRTRTARVLKSIPARYLFALTGTPLENRLEEAYAIAQLIDQRLLPPLWQIERDHFVRDWKGRRVVMYRNLDALRARLAPAFLRRRKEDVALELPERVRSVLMVPMHPAVVDTYDDVMAQVARIACKKVLLPADLERMQRLLVIARRCCNGPHMLGLGAGPRRAAPKLDELEQALRDLCLGERRKAVVFSEWTDMTEQVEALCRRLKPPAFHLRGDVPVRHRPALIRCFTESAAPAVFVSTDAGGMGLNLQAADVIVNLDLPWNPARLEQRIARVHRIGSRRTIQEILLVCKDSIEERILRLHETKRNVLDNVWSRQGQDVIAAPGGSGAFREMVLALLRTQGPAAVAQVEEEPARSEPYAAMVIVEPTATNETSVLSAPDEAPVSLQEAPAPAVFAPVTPASQSVVDAAALSAALTAIAPALPLEHRSSLATVFRALAEALETGTAPSPVAVPGEGGRPALVAPARRPHAPLDQ